MEAVAASVSVHVYESARSYRASTGSDAPCPERHDQTQNREEPGEGYSVTQKHLCRTNSPLPRAHADEAAPERPVRGSRPSSNVKPRFGVNELTPENHCISALIVGNGIHLCIRCLPDLLPPDRGGTAHRGQRRAGPRRVANKPSRRWVSQHPTVAFVPNLYNIVAAATRGNQLHNAGGD